MKKLLLCGVALGAVAIANSASAADMPLKAPPLPGWGWAGFYAGVNVGYGWAFGSGNFNRHNDDRLLPPRAMRPLPFPLSLPIQRLQRLPPVPAT